MRTWDILTRHSSVWTPASGEGGNVATNPGSHPCTQQGPSSLRLWLRKPHRGAHMPSLTTGSDADMQLRKGGAGTRVAGHGFWHTQLSSPVGTAASIVSADMRKLATGEIVTQPRKDIQSHPLSNRAGGHSHSYAGRTFRGENDTHCCCSV